MIVVALPQVARDLRVDVAETSWIVTSYLIAMAALQPIAGRVGDRLGRRNVMLAALVYFAVASAGAAVANSILVLAVFRINQAIAAAALVPNGLGLLREAIPSGRRGAEFGIVSAATAVGATVGPLVGGFLAAIDWRWLFLVNGPLCAAGFPLSWRGPSSPGARGRERAGRDGARGVLRRCDHPGAAGRTRRRSLRTAPADLHRRVGARGWPHTTRHFRGSASPGAPRRDAGPRRCWARAHVPLDAARGGRGRPGAIFGPRVGRGLHKPLPRRNARIPRDRPRAPPPSPDRPAAHPLL